MGKRILVVEDQPDSRQIIRDMLARTDYEITEAESGEQALALIAKQRPDLILMDIQLPIMDGLLVDMSPGFSKGTIRLICLSKHQRVTHWRSTSRPPTRWASAFHMAY
jgi:DNA-binding response OmpR family regulator